MHAVMGVASGYKPVVIERFAKSIRRVNTTCKIILFVEDSDLENYSGLAKQYDIDFVIFCKPPYHIHAYRFKLYYDYLKENKVDGYILLCDVRDLIFAKDPFNKLDKALIHFVMEDRPIGMSAFNLSWLYYSFDGEVLDKVHDEPISCAGTTFGTREILLDYLGLMNETSQRILNAGGVIMPCVDQGFHNYIVSYLEFAKNNRKLWFNKDDFVYTLSYTRDISGSAHVYHQFDRLNRIELEHFATKEDIRIDDLLEKRSEIHKGSVAYARFEVFDDDQRQLAVREVNPIPIGIAEPYLGALLLDLTRGLCLGDRVSYKTSILPPFIKSLMKERQIDAKDAMAHDFIRYSDVNIDMLMTKPVMEGEIARLVPCESSEYTVNIQFAI